MAAIFGPASWHTRGIVASIAMRFNIPHIEYVWRENDRLEEENEKRKTPSMTINVFPASEQISKVSRYTKKNILQLEINLIDINPNCKILKELFNNASNDSIHLFT